MTAVPCVEGFAQSGTAVSLKKLLEQGRHIGSSAAEGSRCIALGAY